MAKVNLLQFLGKGVLAYSSKILVPWHWMGGDIDSGCRVTP